jgi:hypothetical protein
MPAEQTIDQARGLIDVLLALLDWPFLLFVFLLTVISPILSTASNT